MSEVLVCVRAVVSCCYQKPLNCGKQTFSFSKEGPWTNIKIVHGSFFQSWKKVNLPFLAHNQLHQHMYIRGRLICTNDHVSVQLQQQNVHCKIGMCISLHFWHKHYSWHRSKCHNQALNSYPWSYFFAQKYFFALDCFQLTNKMDIIALITAILTVIFT